MPENVSLPDWGSGARWATEFEDASRGLALGRGYGSQREHSQMGPQALRRNLPRLLRSDVTRALYLRWLRASFATPMIDSLVGSTVQS